MLNPKTNQRELAYVVTIDSITPLEGYDRVELAHVGGWTIVVGKENFKPGDLGVYFEIDSKLPMVKPFVDMEFLAKKKFKIKTQKMCGVISQGLLMSASDFGGELYQDGDGTQYIRINEKSYAKGDFLTEVLGVTYASAADNERKKRTTDKYKRMSQRLGAKANTPFYKWMYQREWGKKVLYLLYGNKRKDGVIPWPAHICKKTDVERIQNQLYLLNDKQPYVATEKVDGSSFTVAIERGLFGRYKYYICSRNIVFKDESQKSYYDDNIWYEMYFKYNLKDKITQMIEDLNVSNLAIQMEIYGSGVQKRDYSINEHRIAVFHIISNREKLPMDRVVELCEKYDLPHVPIVCDNFIFPNTIEELQAFVEGAPSKLDGKMREGIVFYDKATGQIYTKFVSPEYLLKFH